MSLLKWGFIGVILLPVAEMAAFFIVAMTIGWFSAVALFLATSFAGWLVLKRAGRADLERFRSAVGTEGLRAINLETPGLATIAGGFLLLIPGFVTDVVGAALFVPACRRWVRAAIGRASEKRRAAQNPAVVDLGPNEWHQISEAIEDHREPKRARPRSQKRKS